MFVLALSSPEKQYCLEHPRDGVCSRAEFSRETALFGAPWRVVFILGLRSAEKQHCLEHP